MNSEKLNFIKQSESEMIHTPERFYDKIKERRAVRDFSTDAIPNEIIQNAIMSAGTAPSEANMQPCVFQLPRT